MKRIIFIEGLPGVGKTTIINKLRNIENVNVVDEVINAQTEENRTKYFLKNDEIKLNLYKNGLIVIDGGFLNTLSYEQTKKIINYNYDNSLAIKWFDNHKNIYKKSNVFVLYLRRKNDDYYLPYDDDKNPFGTVENEILLENISLYNLKKYVKNYKIIDYDYNEMDNIINEFIIGQK